VGLPPIDDASDLVSSAIEVPDDVIEGVLHNGGKAVAGGTSKSNKTWVLSDMAVSVATGENFLGFPTKRGHVLFINLEIQKAFFSRRIATICDKKGVQLEPGYLRVWNLRGHSADIAVLLPLLLRRIRPGQYVLIIIDPIYKLLGGRDENKAGDIASLLNDVERLAVETGAAVAFGAHYSKGNQSGKEPIDRIGGSGVFARDPDSILNFTRHEREGCFTVEMTLRNHPPVPPFVVRWEYPLMQREESLDPARLKKPAGRKPLFTTDDLLELIADEPLGTNDWQKDAESELQMGRRTFFRRLKEIETDNSPSPMRTGNGVQKTQTSRNRQDTGRATPATNERAKLS
jgi:hypothetical protein